MPAAKPRKPGQGDPNQFKSRAPVKCVVDGCDKTVYGIYEMCRGHHEAYLDGRLLPRRQTVALPAPAVPPPAKQERKEPPVPEPIPVLCNEPGCTEPAKVGRDNRQYKKCDTHWREAHARAGRSRPPAPEPELVAPDAPPAPPVDLVQPVVQRLHDALAGLGDVSVSVDALSITFRGEIHILTERAHEAD
jgi:hypothetical protein